jgi:hypothetical protein
MLASQDWTQFVLDLPLVAQPGTEWAYCSSAVYLVSAILQGATGLDARSFANRYLFAPIGIRPVPPERWPSDPAGISTGGHGLQLTPLEVARFAYLYLNAGRWGDRQVVPQAWVAASLAPQIHVGRMKEYGDMDRSYGYLWSLYPKEQFYSALGRNGQHIHIFPDENMLVVFNSATRVVTDEAQFTLLKDFILPAIQSGAALPENAGGLARLQAAVKDAAWPQRPVNPLPAAGRALNGKTIRIGENPFGWQVMSLHFAEGASTAEIRFDNGVELLVGLDNLYRVQDLPGTGQVGLRGDWVRPDRFTVQQVVLGTWGEYEISLTIDGDQVILFQRNVVDGGGLVRMTGHVEQ